MASDPPKMSPESKKKGKQKELVLPSLELVKTLRQPSLPGATGTVTFRAGRQAHNPPPSFISTTDVLYGSSFNPEREQTFYTITNIVPHRTRKGKTAPRQSYLCKWSAKTWETTKIKKIGDRVITCFQVRCVALSHSFRRRGAFAERGERFSPDGRFLAYGSSDYAIGVLDSISFSVSCFCALFAFHGAEHLF